jgi:hypothetical protein
MDQKRGFFAMAITFLKVKVIHSEHPKKAKVCDGIGQ